MGNTLYYFYRKEFIELRSRSYDDVKKHYSDDELCTLCNIKQIVFYAKNHVQPLIIDEGWDGKLLAIYDVKDTKNVWEIWKSHKKSKK